MHFYSLHMFLNIDYYAIPSITALLIGKTCFWECFFYMVVFKCLANFFNAGNVKALSFTVIKTQSTHYNPI